MCCNAGDAGAGQHIQRCEHNMHMHMLMRMCIQARTHKRTTYMSVLTDDVGDPGSFDWSSLASFTSLTTLHVGWPVPVHPVLSHMPPSLRTLDLVIAQRPIARHAHIVDTAASRGCDGGRYHRCGACGGATPQFAAFGAGGKRDGTTLSAIHTSHGHVTSHTSTAH